LKGSSPLQIVVTQGIYDLTKGEPGFEFKALSPTDASPGDPLGVHELIWTDEATYVRARREIQEQDAAPPALRRYSIESQLGRGSMGVVYKAQDRFINRTVALKTISLGNEEINRTELIERLRQEAKAAGSLDHPNIITIYDVAEEGDLFYLSMQYVEGTTLSSMLADGKLLPLPTLLTYIDQICNAVGFAHAHGVIHRDLKPSNLMLTKAGLIKVLDFGIAKLGDAGLTQAGMVVGTPGYMAPEQAAGRRVDHRSDIFSLGAVFYEFFTGEKAFDGQSITSVLYKVMNEDPIPPSVLDPSLPRGIDAILQRALAKDPGQRFQSCEEMREVFRTQAATAESSAKAEHSVPAQVPATGMGEASLRGDSAAPERSPSAVPVPAPLLAYPRTGDMPDHPGAAVVRQIKRFAGIVLATCVCAAVAMTIIIIHSSRSRSPKDSQPGKAASPTAQAPGISVQNPSPVQPAPVSTPGSASSATVPAVNSPPSNPAPTLPEAAPPAAGQTKSAVDSASSTASKKSKRSSSAEKTSDRSRAPEEGRDNEMFGRSEIPDLLRRGDDARGSGHYDEAIAAYNHVLRLDKQNAEAREGLRRIAEIEKDKHR
jgi:serine/threonine protein kinase